MKKSILAAAAVLLVFAGAATAQAKVYFNVNIDVPVPVAPVPVVTSTSYDPYPSYAPQVAVTETPNFIYSPNLGFYVSVGIPYDIAYVNNGYYLYRGGYWYLSPSYRGPWALVSQRRLPPVLHKHRYEQIRYYRDREYRSYLHDRQNYRGNWYRPVEYRGADRWDGRRDHNRDGRWDGRRDHDRDGRKDHRDGRGR